MFLGNRDVVSIIKDGLEKMLDFFLLAYKKMTAAARHSIIQVTKISAKPFKTFKLFKIMFFLDFYILWQTLT